MSVDRREAAPRREGAATPYLLALLFGVNIGWVNLQTDLTPFVALTLLAATFILSLVWPRHARRWGLLVGIWLPLAEAVALLTSIRVPYTDAPTDVFQVLVFSLILGLVGATAGAFLARLVGRS